MTDTTSRTDGGRTDGDRTDGNRADSSSYTTNGIKRDKTNDTNA